MGLTYDDGNKAFANGEAAMIIKWKLGNQPVQKCKCRYQCGYVCTPGFQ